MFHYQQLFRINLKLHFKVGWSLLGFSRWVLLHLLSTTYTIKKGNCFIPYNFFN